MKVCVVGAGFAGLSVAYHLVKHNTQVSRDSSNDSDFEVVVLEARDRVGGRVHPVNLEEGVIVDMGGQWIHEASSQRNPIVGLCKELDIPLAGSQNQNGNKKNRSTSSSSRAEKKADPRSSVSSGFYLPDGTRLPDHVVTKARRFYYKALEDYNERDITVHTSWQDLLDSAVEKKKEKHANGNEKINNGPEVDVDALFPRILNCLAHHTEIYEGGRLSELSVSLDSLYINLGGPDEIAEGGYHAVLQKLVNCIGMDKIHLNCPVQYIKYEPCLSKTIRNDEQNACNNNKETTRNGVQIRHSINDEKEKILWADCCVCTVPLGVLQQQSIKFDPPLSDAHQQSLQAMGMGLLDKVMMLFERQFWCDDFYATVVAPSDDPSEIQTFIDCSDDYEGRPVLAMLLGGDVARRLYNNGDDNDDGQVLSDEQVVTEALSTLRTLFKDTDDLPIPQLQTYRVSRWLRDPYAYGSYSFAKVGSKEQDYKHVARPAGKNLFFAGEHTSKHHHSTVHGAWMTGKREADRLIRQTQNAKGQY